MASFLLLPLTAASSCLPIKCQDVFDPYSRCVEVTETIKVSGCPAGMYCPSYSDVSSYNQSLYFMDTYCELNPFQVPVDLCTNTSYTSTQLPGDQCCTNWNCVSNICNNLICQGLPVSSSCSQNEMCQPGLYCGENNTCVTALPAGGSCTSDLQCKIGYGCNNKFCTKLWSIGYTDRAEDPKFCVSNYAYGGYCDMIQIKLNGTKVINSPFQCNLNDICSYYSAAFRIVLENSACLCSGDPNLTTGYCGLYINQVEGMFEELYAEMQYSSSRCSGPKAHSADPYELWQCGSITSSLYQRYITKTQRNQHWSLYRSGVLDECAQSIPLFEISSSTVLTAIFLSFFT